MLFSWYFKGFELLRQYLVKHPSGVDMAKLDLEEVDQEMAADKANHSATKTDAPETAPTNEAPEGVPADVHAPRRMLLETPEPGPLKKSSLFASVFFCRSWS